MIEWKNKKKNLIRIQKNRDKSIFIWTFDIKNYFDILRNESVLYTSLFIL